MQRLRRLVADRGERDTAGVAICEGERLVDEALAAGLVVEDLYVTSGVAVDPSWPSVTEVADGVIDRVASTTTSRPVLAVVRRPSVAPGILDRAAFVLVADRIADPGNVGTIVRSAEASGVEVVVLTPGSADPWSPKVVRSSAGSVFRMPIVVAEISDVRRSGLRLLGATSHGSGARSYDEVDVAGRVAIVVGNESHGIAPDVEVEEWVTIPHRGPAESLNVAMAATVLLFEASRRRRTAG